MLAWICGKHLFEIFTTHRQHKLMSRKETAITSKCCIYKILLQRIDNINFWKDLLKRIMTMNV